MTDVFISYSRSDIALARLMQKSLQAQGLNTWIDWEQIAVGDKWWLEIKEAIENANVFLFIISRNSFNSQVCHDEVDHAIKNNKRIIPIIVDEFSPQELREISTSLPEYNWIRLKQEALRGLETVQKTHQEFNNALKSLSSLDPDFDVTLEKIHKAIKADYQWVKFHTRLQLKALEWEKKKDISRLLRGRELQETESEVLKITEDKEPRLTSLQQVFLIESQKNRNRARTIITFCIFVIALVMGGLGFWGQKNAVAARSSEKTAQAEKAIAENLANINEARFLASAAQNNASTDQSLSLLLTIESVIRINPTLPQAEADLRNLLSNFGSISVGNGLGVIANNGEWITVGYLSDYELFNLAQSPFGFWLTSRIDQITYFTQGEKRIAYIDEQGSLYYFDLLEDNSQPVLLKEIADTVQDIKLDPSGRWLVINEEFKNTQIMDLDLIENKPKLLDAKYTFTEELFFIGDRNSIVLFKKHNSIKMINLITGEEKSIQGIDKAGESILISPDSDWLVSGSYIWDLTDPDAQPALIPNFGEGELIFNDSGDWLFQRYDETGEFQYSQRAWSLNSDYIENVPLPEKLCNFSWIEISSDEKWFYCSPQYFDLLFITTDDSNAKPIRLSGSDPVFSQNGELLAFVNDGGLLSIYNFSDGSENTFDILDLDNGIGSIQFFPDGRRLAVIDFGGNLHLLDPDSSTSFQKMVPGFSDAPYIFSINKTEKFFNIIDRTMHFRITDAEEPVSEPETFVISDEVTGVKVSNDGRWIAFLDGEYIYLKDHQNVYADVSIPLTEIPQYFVFGLNSNDDYLIMNYGNMLQFIAIPGTDGSDRQVSIYPPLDSSLSRFQSSPDGKSYVFSNNNSFSLVKLADELSAQNFSNFEASKTQVFTPDGKWLFFSGFDSSLSKINLKTLEIDQFTNDSGVISELIISGDGKWLVSTGDDQKVKIWNLSTSQKNASKVLTLPSEITKTIVSYDGRWLACVLKNKQLWLYDLNDLSDSPQEIAVNGDFVRSIAFSPDSKFLASGSDNGSFQLWDLSSTTLQPVTVFGHELDVTSIQFSSDNQWIITRSADQTMRYWSYRLDDVIHKACSLAGRNLTLEEWKHYFPDEEYRETCKVN